MTATTITASTQVKATLTAPTDEVLKLKQDFAKKNIELSKTEDETKKSAIRKAITDLEAKIQKASAEKSQDAKKVDTNQSEDAQSAPRMAGESERIGTTNFDADAGFGTRVAYV